MELGSNMVLNNMFFDPGKAMLRPESTAELERLQKLLTETPELKLHVWPATPTTWASSTPTRT